MKMLPRSYNYLLVILVMVVIAVWVGSHTWADLRQLHRSFASAHADDMYIPIYVEATIHELNDLLVQIEMHQDPKDRAAFEKESEELGEWIRARQDTLTTANQRQLLDSIEATYRLYQTQSRQMMEQGPAAPFNESGITVLARVETNATPVVNLCRQLNESERTEQAQFMKASQQALAWIQDLLLVVLMVLIILVATAMTTVFRGVIGPLRVELNRSRNMAVRNEKLAALGTLAAGVAHEIRNPLTAINVRLHSLKKGLANNSSEQEDALVIGHEINRLERIVQEFLQFARPTEPKFVIASMDSLLAKVRTLLQSQLEKSGIELKLEHAPDVWVRVDPYQIEQVLINLIKNAAESIQQNGTITLRVGTSTASRTNRNRPIVSLEVIDTGRGIPPETMKHIFDPFFTTKEEGTGLGLVIASRIIEKHHGTLECRSELNRGTIFTILLPRSSPGEMNEPTT